MSRTRLRTAPHRLQQAPARLAPAPTRSERRITGRQLQARRLRIWAQDPHCADCRQLVDYPDGFELDHEVALVNGGADTDDNCRVRCHACHEAKTARDLAAARS